MGYLQSACNCGFVHVNVLHNIPLQCTCTCTCTLHVHVHIDEINRWNNLGKSNLL